MAIFTDTRGGQQHRMMYVNPDGREYWVSLTSLGPFNEVPPLVVFEREDGFLEVPSKGRVYESLHDLAIEHGCLLGDLMSVDPTN